MTRAKSRTIREIIEDYDNFMSSGADVGVKNRQIYVALKEIETLLLESVDDTELKDVYSKADTTEQALPQLKVNYKSQIKANLLKILGGEK